MIYDVALFVGHGTSEVDGSYDPGATHNGKQEHLIAERIVDRAVVLCTNKGINVHRDEQNYKDNDLLGNTYNYKYAMEVHLNGGKGRRAELFSPCKEKDLKGGFYALAELAKLGLNNGGVKSRDYDSERTFMRTNGVTLPYTDYYGVINRAWSQGISLDLLEVGFIDSDDIYIIENNIEKIATIIANVMCDLCKKPLYTIGGSGSTPAPSKELYRVRRSWLDAASQVGAFEELDYAKAECDKRDGFGVYNTSGTLVYSRHQPITPPPVVTPPQTGEYEVSRKNEMGTFTCKEDLIYFRAKPYVGSDNPTTGNYVRNEAVNYDSVVKTNKYVWISWANAAGVRRYMPVRDVLPNGTLGDLWGTII